MIIVQDRIKVSAEHLDRVYSLFMDEYLPEAGARGLAFVESLVAPPLKTASAPVTLWLRWQVADPAAWWAMRAQSSTESVAAFWQALDGLCLARERSYLAPGDTAGLPAGQDVTDFEIGTRGHRETAQLSLREDLTEDGRAELESILGAASSALPGIEAATLSGNLAPEYAAGDYTWDLLYPDAATAAAARKSGFWIEQIAPALARFCRHCHALELRTIGAGLRRPGITNAVKRTAFFRLLPGMESRASAFERDLLEMPGHIPEILNWRLSHAQPLPWNSAECAPWSYVWEQEFESIEDLMGPYMMHPHHWAHIDRWFDPESGVQAVDVDLSHAFSPLAQSVITVEAE